MLFRTHYSLESLSRSWTFPTRRSDNREIIESEIAVRRPKQRISEPKWKKAGVVARRAIHHRWWTRMTSRQHGPLTKDMLRRIDEMIVGCVNLLPTAISRVYVIHVLWFKPSLLSVPFHLYHHHPSCELHNTVNYKYPFNFAVVTDNIIGASESPQLYKAQTIQTNTLTAKEIGDVGP